MTAKAPSPKSGHPKVFDITRPGKSAPSASAKPIIITHRPVLQDPMVVGDNATPAPTSSVTDSPKPVAPTVSKARIEPLHISVGTDKPGAKTATEEPADSAPTAIAVSVSATSQAETPASEQQDAVIDVTSDDKPDDTASPAAKPTADSDNSADNAAVSDNKDDSADPSKDAADPKAAEIAARKAAERAAELGKLAENHTYYLPINQVEKRRNKRNTLLGLLLIVILCLAWGDIALDAGIIKLGNVKPVTHFFDKSNPGR